MKGFISTRHSKPGLKSAGSTEKAGANVKGSRLNQKGDKHWRGKRGGEAMVGKSGGKSKSMGY